MCDTKIFGRTSLVQKIFGPNKFCQKRFWSKKIKVPKNLGSKSLVKIVSVTAEILLQKILLNFFLLNIFFWSTKYLGEKVKIIFVQKYVWSKKNIWAKKVLSKKMLV